jgi:hypothetical protein
LREFYKEDMNHKISKRTEGQASKPRSADLTCSEAQVEDLLSEGESTESDGGEDGRSEEETTPKASPLKTAPIKSSARPRR